MSLLIRNVEILGGERDYPGRHDVFISGDRISAIGNFPTKGADEVIDGQGAYLSPGFIDVNTDSDHYLTLFEHPEQEDFLRQGVTTIAGGMCGASLAPLIYGSLESVQKWGDVTKVNVDWGTMAEFLSVLEKKPLAVNFLTLVGHSTIRRAILKDEIRESTKNELGVIGNMLKRSLDDGGFGFSTGLSYVHSHKATYPELKSLAEITKKYGGVYATHLRKSGAEIRQSINETVKLAEETGAKTLISHFLPLRGYEEEYKSALEKINNLPQEIDLHFDLYLSDKSILALYTFLPEWVKTGGREVILKKLKDKWLWPKIVKDLPKIEKGDFTIAQAPGNDFLVGKSLDEVAEAYGTSREDALLRLMVITKLRGTALYRNINRELIAYALMSPRSLVASNAAAYPANSGRFFKPDRATSTFIKFLTRTRRERIMNLGAAIKKITVIPAEKFGIKKRGVIKEGNFADLVIFSFASEDIIKTVIVNGAVAIKDKNFKGRLSGRVLRRQ